MKTQEEKNQLSKPNNRLLLIVGMVVGGIMLTAVLYNVFQSTPDQVSVYQPEVRGGDAQFLRSAPPEEPANEDPQETTVQESGLQPPETIFQRSARLREQRQQEQQRQPQQQQRHQNQQQEAPDRSQQLYEQALESQISLGGSISTRTGVSSGQTHQGTRQQGYQEPVQYPEEYRGRGSRSGTQRASRDQNITQFDNPATPYSIMEGTLVEATLQTAITSALPGNITAVINRDIYDSINQNYLLIPRGSRLIGSYDSSIAFDQRKLMMSWDRLIFPDGRSMRLPGVPTHDLMGMSGLGGDVNTHFWSIFGQSAMLSLIGAGASVAISPGGGGSVFAGLSPRQTIAMQVAQDFQRVANMVMQRNMNRQPTIEIEAGTPFTVFVLDDIFFEEPYTYTEVYNQR